MNKSLIDLFGKPRTQALMTEILPPFMDRYLELTTQYTDARPGLLLTAWLPYCAVNLGNRAYMYNNSARVYPNFWTCIVGPSSVSRKSTALRYGGYTIKPFEDSLRDLPVDVYEDQAMTLTGVTLSKLMSYLAQNPARLFVQNEISGWLGEMGKPFNAGYKQIITELFDGVDRTVATRDRTERILSPALSIASASTEGWLFRDLMLSADQLGGFLQRFLFYMVRDVKFEDVDLYNHNAEDLEHQLASFDKDYFSWWRRLQGPCKIILGPEAQEFRNDSYSVRYKNQYEKKNDAMMSYFTRIYDGYWYKFCILIHLADDPLALAAAIQSDRVQEFLHQRPVSYNTALQAMYLCEFYLDNTLPLLEMLEEQDKLAGERKIVNSLINKFNGSAKHSELMNTCHMGKREFRAAIETLLEREAITVQTYVQHKTPGRLYLLAAEIADTWKD